MSELRQAHVAAYRLALMLFAMASRHADEDLKAARREVERASAALNRLLDAEARP